MALSVFEIMHWLSVFLKEYRLSNKFVAFHRCQLVSVTQNKLGQRIAEVKVHGTQGILSSLPVYYPLDQLLSDEAMLAEFSQSDVRTMTLYLAFDHFEQVQNKVLRYRIELQEFYQGKTIYMIQDAFSKRYLRKTAAELFDDNEVLKNCSIADVKNIIASAIQENMVTAMECLNERK